MTMAQLEQIFAKGLQGKAVHRLKDAKVILGNTEPAALGLLVKWRKTAHYLHANALVQGWFLTISDWSALKGCSVMFGDTKYSLQVVVAGQVTW